MKIDTFLTQAQLAALGAVVVKSAEFERMVDVVLWDVTKMNPNHYKVLIGDTMMANKLRLLKQFGLAKLKSEKRRQEFKKLIADLAQANGERAIAVHGSWGPIGGATLAELMTQEYASRPIEATHKQSSRLSADRLEALAQKFIDGRKALGSFWAVNWIVPAVRRAEQRKSKLGALSR